MTLRHTILNSPRTCPIWRTEGRFRGVGGWRPARCSPEEYRGLDHLRHERPHWGNRERYLRQVLRVRYVFVKDVIISRIITSSSPWQPRHRYYGLHGNHGSISHSFTRVAFSLQVTSRTCTQTWTGELDTWRATSASSTSSTTVSKPSSVCDDVAAN